VINAGINTTIQRDINLIANLVVERLKDAEER
jgi:hypothetical protein